VLCLAAAGVVVSLLVHKPGGQLGAIFTICCLLYLIAPFSIVRHLLVRREIDTETLLGAIAAYCRCSSRCFSYAATPSAIGYRPRIR
jgi:hypothetical protein